MGFSERVCQICGVSFNVGRIRTKDEPTKAGWGGRLRGNSPVFDPECEADGCANEERMIPEFVCHDGSVSEAEQAIEHLAGPSCISTSGYSGHRITWKEMKDCTQVQCLKYKASDWEPEPGDEDFVLQSRDAFLTGISTGAPDEFEVHRLEPVRHGVRDTPMTNELLDDDSEDGMPMHAQCFQVFRELSIRKFGRTDIDSLIDLWAQQGSMENRFDDFQETLDLQLVVHQLHRHVPGTEYMVAHPHDVEGLNDLIDRCTINGAAHTDAVFENSDDKAHVADPFASLPPELRLMLLLQLERTDVTNLRLVSRSFQQLPQKYFHNLITTEMPRVWEIDNQEPGTINWHQLWCALSAADGGAGVDELVRAWVTDGEYLHVSAEL
ncbi:uncharacterized protein LTR77_001809 [Saxophila tyrrhenica]|uniref:F-box domain-containing protein n=1 Tax=Saxophila tyrrhenica TaxID=1690608 RepID=A0AAV9PQY4_9PEZI|nr:hypothetical protein LTR77_001809 [Saxophila tyrrhenica]